MSDLTKPRYRATYNKNQFIISMFVFSTLIFLVTYLSKWQECTVGTNTPPNIERTFASYSKESACIKAVAVCKQYGTEAECKIKDQEKL